MEVCRLTAVMTIIFQYYEIYYTYIAIKALEDLHYGPRHRHKPQAKYATSFIAHEAVNVNNKFCCGGYVDIPVTILRVEVNE